MHIVNHALSYFAQCNLTVLIPHTHTHTPTRTPTHTHTHTHTHRQLLLDCGIGEDGEGEGAAVGQHRALLFCQYKSMLDIIEKDLFK